MEKMKYAPEKKRKFYEYCKFFFFLICSEQTIVQNEQLRILGGSEPRTALLL